MTAITRFAPSPTGYLHLGHAFSALFADREARPKGGHMLLRIEDIDQTRCRPDYEAAISEDLGWLGLEWPRPIRRQSDHFADYAAALDRLRDKGVLYPCFCTRKEIAAEIARAGGAPHAADGTQLYPGTCRHMDVAERQRRLAAGLPYAWRLDSAQAYALTGPLSFTDLAAGEIAVDPGLLGDCVLARKDTPVSYHLAVTHDDALQKVTLVTRAVDLLPSTHVHRLLQALLGWPAPLYHHHEMLKDAAGAKFSKRDDAVTLRALREQGETPASIRKKLGF